MKNNIREIRRQQHLTLEKLADMTGISTSFLSRIESGTRGVKLEHALEIARALNVMPSDLGTGVPASVSEHGPKQTTMVTGNVRPADVEMPPATELPKDVPVLGTVAGSNAGAFQLSSEPIDYVRRPPALLKARGIYGLFVEGDSMDPEHKSGELRYINPHKKLNINDSVVLETKTDEHAEPEAMIGRLLRNNTDHYLIGKLNPPTELKVSKEVVLRVHKVLTLNELFGI